MILQSNETNKENLISYISSLLPESIRTVCKNYLFAYENISEIRLRLDAPLSFTESGSNLITKIICTNEDIAFCINKMTDGNFSKYDEMMRSGVITLDYGCRAGVCGKVFSSENMVKLLLSVDYICLRIPCHPTVPKNEIFDFLEKNDFSKSLLVISPPGVGKTTVLRSLAIELSTPPVSKRVAVVDTLDELKVKDKLSSSLCDFLTGYPKAEGILIACRFLAPEYIICDEICGTDETEAILDIQHSGIPFIASAHAGTFCDVKLNKNLRKLLENRVFDAVVRLSRKGKLLSFEIKNTEEILK